VYEDRIFVPEPYSFFGTGILHGTDKKFSGLVNMVRAEFGFEPSFRFVTPGLESDTESVLSCKPPSYS